MEGLYCPEAEFAVTMPGSVQSQYVLDRPVGARGNSSVQASLISPAVTPYAQVDLQR